MPRTFNGIGTKYYGASDRQTDGSFVTTEWLTVFAPIIPLRSLRVHYLGRRNLGNRTSSELYNVVGQSSLDTKQVLQVYGLHLATWILVFASLFFPGMAVETASSVATVLMVAAIIFWIWIMPDLLYKAR